MLHEFLTANRQELIDRCREKVLKRSAPAPDRAELEHGIPLFLDQLTQTLHLDGDFDAGESLKVSGTPYGGPASSASNIGITAGKHGNDLLEQGFTIGQVVHDYGDLCQAVTELAAEKETSINVEEFRTLNRCLDNAIADAVTELRVTAVGNERRERRWDAAEVGRYRSRGIGTGLRDVTGRELLELAREADLQSPSRPDAACVTPATRWTWRPPGPMPWPPRRRASPI